jgi:hypothetical protein
LSEKGTTGEKKIRGGFPASNASSVGVAFLLRDGMRALGRKKEGSIRWFFSFFAREFHSGEWQGFFK